MTHEPFRYYHNEFGKRQFFATYCINIAYDWSNLLLLFHVNNHTVTRITPYIIKYFSNTKIIVNQVFPLQIQREMKNIKQRETQLYSFSLLSCLGS